jgi:tetratricopeptide (TPR) repeat protein
MLLRQGKLDLAIAEYRSVVEDQPADLNTANALGDLYIRAGQIDKGIGEYGRIADHFAREGFSSKAVALYKKILKIKPDEDRALWQLGSISADQGLLVDARSAFLAVAERRRARGDRRGEAEARINLGDLEGADLETRLAGARARVELGETAAAVERLKQAAAGYREKGREVEALHLLTEGFKIDPEDADLRRMLMQAYVARGDFESARYYATSAGERKELAEELFQQGREDEALAVLTLAAEADPADIAIRSQLVKRLLARGDMAAARVMLTSEVAGADPELQWTLAEMELHQGRIAEGTAVLQQMLVDDPSRRDALVILGCSVAEVNSDAGFACIEVATRAAIAAGEWASAAAAVNEFVNRVPHHIQALMRLVEICVDGGLEATMHSAQAQLADAYLVAGAGAEARIIAEDLVAREPWDRANIERFRRALALLGEANIDATIAERLSGESPFTTTDFLWPSEPGGTELAPTPVGGHAKVSEPPTVAEPTTSESRKAVSRGSRAWGSNAAAEVDLSGVLHDLPTGESKGGSAKPALSLENVLKGMRGKAKHDESPATAELHFKRAQDYLETGLQDEAIKAFEIAARSPRHRFRVGAVLAKLYLDRGDRMHAIEWYERAAEAPAPDAESAHALLYDLATALEAQGDNARALAVLLELQAEAGDYRDLTARLEHLTGGS